MQPSVYTLTIPGPSLTLTVVRFEGSEEISGLYRYDATVSCADPGLSFDDLVGKPAVLTMRLGAEPRHVHGIILAIEQDETGKRQSYYRVTLVPELWAADQKQDFRIFQDLDVTEIIDQVLGDAKLGASDHRFSLVGSYPKRGYCVQYRESDWDFISRLIEEEGLHCFFEHAADKHTLVIGDSPSAHAPLAGDATLRFLPATGALFQAESVCVFRFRQAMLPDRVTLRDYDFKRPRLSLETDADVAQGTPIEVYDYPGGYQEPAVGSRLAKLRLELWQGARQTASGRSTCARFAPGYCFTLSEHPRDGLNRSYLLVRVESYGEAEGGAGSAGGGQAYTNSFVCIPDDAPYRTPLRTPKPTVKGVQTAVVTGPGGDEIFTDEHGRVKVQFHWDRRGKNDDRTSCWVRVAQVWAGSAWGAMFIPRVGHEVVVSFLEGDPDRPLITGSVYHGVNKPPVALPADKTKSTLKSSSSPGGEGSNELRFEDKKGEEEIFLHGQKDLTIGVEHDKTQTIGHDESLAVTNDRTKDVGGNETETIGGDKSIEVTGKHQEKIGASAKLEVGKEQSVKVGDKMSLEVGDGKVTVEKDGTITVEGKDIKVKGSGTITVDGDKVKIKSKGAVDVKADGDVKLKGGSVKLN